MSTGKLIAVSHACVLSINRTIYRKLEELGWDVELVIPKVWRYHGKSQPPESAIENDPKLNLLEVQGDSPRTYQFIGLEELLADRNPDVVLLDIDPISYQALHTGRWCKRNGVKLACLSCENLPFDLVSTVKRGGVTKAPSWFAKRWISIQSRRLIDLVFTINSDGKRIFEREGFNQVSLMPLGFSEEIFYTDLEARHAIREKLGLNVLTFAYFGRLTPEKGVHCLVEALGKMLDLNWQLMLDHFDPSTDTYVDQLSKKLSENGVDKRTVFIHADHKEIAKYMNAADVVVVPSLETPRWKEQYGRVAPEAMACGKVVVVAKTGALPELVGDCGLYVESGDVSGLERLLRGLYGQEDRLKEIGELATDRAHSKLGIRAQASCMDNSFRQLLGRAQ